MGTSSVRSSAAVNPLASLQQYGQSVWLDFIRATLISGGELQRMLDQDGLGGVTSNPAIFAKAIDGSDDYKASIQEISKDPSIGAKRVYELLAIKDIQGAADLLRPVYDRTKGHDGYVSLEVAPDLAQRHPGDARRSAAPLEGGRPSQRHDQGAGHARRRARHPHPPHRRHQRQRHAALLEGRVRGRGPGLRGGHRGPRGQGPARGQGGQRGQLLREPHRQRRRRAARGEDEDGHRTGQGAHAAAAGQGRHRQRQGRLPELQEDVLRSALGAPRQEGRADTACALGQHGHQEPELPRHDLRRGADRGPHRQHRPSGHLQRLPRSRQAAAEPGGGRHGSDGRAGRPREVRHLAEEGHRRPARGRRWPSSWTRS